MALSSAIVWETRASVGSDSNGGGFAAGASGTDFSQQNAAQVNINNSTITTSITGTTVTFTAGYTPTSADVGNIVQFLTGTNVVTGFYQITAQTSTTWTLDRTPLSSGTTTNATAKMGGALATLGALASAMVASNKAYVTGSFTATATITFAQSVATPSSAAPHTRLIGYGSTRTDGLMATLTLSTNAGLTGINATGTGFAVENLTVDAATLATSTCIALAGQFSYARRSTVKNFTTAGITFGGGSTSAWFVEATGGTAAAAAAINMASQNNTLVVGCNVHDNACTGIVTGSTCMIEMNLVTNNSGASSDGISFTWGCCVLRNTIHNNGRDGIRMQQDIRTPPTILNNVLTNNGGFGLNNASGNPLPALQAYDGNAFFNNTSGARASLDSITGIYGVAPYTNVHDVTLTGSPYIGPTTGTSANFGLNNTVGAGAACRTSGTPGTWMGNSGTTTFLDVGAVQHVSTGSPGIIMATG